MVKFGLEVLPLKRITCFVEPLHFKSVVRGVFNYLKIIDKCKIILKSKLLTGIYSNFVTHNFLLRLTTGIV
jgi:hypothetical protein